MIPAEEMKDRLVNTIELKESANERYTSATSSKLFQHELLTAEKELDLFLKHRAGDKSATNELVRCNIRLILKIARKIAGSNKKFDIMDLIQVGSEGLLIALSKFDPDRGYRLSTYASPWISQSIFRHVAQFEDVIRLPHHIGMRRRLYRSMYIKAANKGNSDPSPESVVETAKLEKPEDSKISLTDYLKVSKSAKAVDVLYVEDFKQDDGDNPNNNEYPLDSLISSMPDSEKSVSSEERKEILLNLMKCTLKDREMFILINRYGIGTDKKTLDQLAGFYNITRERIRQIEKSAVRRLAGELIRRGYKFSDLV